MKNREVDYMILGMVIDRARGDIITSWVANLGFGEREREVAYSLCDSMNKEIKEMDRKVKQARFHGYPDYLGIIKLSIGIDLLKWAPYGDTHKPPNIALGIRRKVTIYRVQQVEVDLRTVPLFE